MAGSNCKFGSKFLLLCLKVFFFIFVTNSFTFIRLALSLRLKASPSQLKGVSNDLLFIIQSDVQSAFKNISTSFLTDQQSCSYLRPSSSQSIQFSHSVIRAFISCLLLNSINYAFGMYIIVAGQSPTTRAEKILFYLRVTISSNPNQSLQCSCRTTLLNI